MNLNNPTAKIMLEENEGAALEWIECVSAFYGVDQPKVKTICCWFLELHSSTRVRTLHQRRIYDPERTNRWTNVIIQNACASGRETEYISLQFFGMVYLACLQWLNKSRSTKQHWIVSIVADGRVRSGDYDGIHLSKSNRKTIICVLAIAARSRIVVSSWKWFCLQFLCFFFFICVISRRYIRIRTRASCVRRFGAKHCKPMSLMEIEES